MASEIDILQSINAPMADAPIRLLRERDGESAEMIHSAE